MPGAHAKLSPSASATWTACPGQPTLAEGIADRGSSIYADRGTAQHKVMEWCVTKKRDASYYRGRAIPVDGPRGSIVLEDDELEAVQVAVDFIRSEIEEGDEFETEVRLRYSDDFWGTLDFDRYRPRNGELLIVDYKGGSGVPVEAKDNPQGVSYALMKVKSLGNRGISTVRFVIIQPRCYHEDGPIREFVVDGVDMLDWEDRIVAAIDKVNEARMARAAVKANDVDARAGFSDEHWAATYLRTGKQCRWCKAAAVCPALAREKDEALQADFAAVEPGGYDLDRLAAALASVEKVKAWAAAVDAFAYAEAERGVEIPGFKLVAKRPTRKVKDEAGVKAVADLLGVPESDLMTVPELKSPAQLEAAFEPHMAGGTKKARVAAAKEFLREHIDSSSSGHALVPESDERKPIRGSAADDFSAVE